MVTDLREYSTLALIAMCYFLWLLFLWKIHTLHPIISAAGLGLLIAFHSSLQHEVLHGHPFSVRALNEALVFIPIGIFVPYQRFRDEHLRHHLDSNLTDPYDDPESNYLAPQVWSKLDMPRRALYRFNNTLLGRMLIGPLIGLVHFYRSDIRAMRSGDEAVWSAWGWHMLGVVLLVGILVGLKVPVLVYVVAAYFGLSLLKIRTFLEHQAHEHVSGRSVIIESRGPLSMLFLNNNYHLVHHSHPALAWYDLPAKYNEGRENYLRRNRGYRYDNYAQVFREYFIRRKDDVPHPLYHEHAKNEKETQ